MKYKNNPLLFLLILLLVAVIFYPNFTRTGQRATRLGASGTHHVGQRITPRIQSPRWFSTQRFRTNLPMPPRPPLISPIIQPQSTLREASNDKSSAITKKSSNRENQIKTHEKASDWLDKQQQRDEEHRRGSSIFYRIYAYLSDLRNRLKQKSSNPASTKEK